MSIWVEIHCDKQIAGADPCGAPLCYAMNGNQPGAMVRIASTTPVVLSALKRAALKDGWTYKHGVWTCPACNHAHKETT